MSRRLFLLTLFLAAQLAWAEGPSKPSTAAMKEIIHAVVRGQLEAFRRGDFAGAYELAAPGVREKFPLAAFTEMVKSGYPEIAANADAVFGLTFDDGDHGVVNVRVIGKDKTERRYQYLVERADKEWRISGVVVLAENDAAI